MKQVIPFTKDIPFKTKIGEITSISLEHNLKLEQDDYITGDFTVSGTYKMTDISINQEPFSYDIPFDITLDNKYNASNARVDIDDFYYEVVNDEILRVNIDVLIEGLQVMVESRIERESLQENNEKENDEEMNDETEIININYDDSNRDPHQVNSIEVTEDLFQEEVESPVAVSEAINEEKIKSLFDSFDENDETFSTYHVHIVREEDTIETIITKYNTNKETLSLYNNIDELNIGDKIIVPAQMNE